MKTLLTLLLSTVLTTMSFAQVFHFNNTSTTLIKTTSQSPAHWYIEIFNDVAIDTTLRWKVVELNAPAQWVFSFDDQDNYYTNVGFLDSADFTLLGNPAFPQKLIIGGTLNDTPGNGNIDFSIYDPETPNDSIVISYIFKVSAATAGELELTAENWLQMNQTTLSFAPYLQHSTVEFYSTSGALLTTQTIDGDIDLNDLDLYSQAIIIKVEQNGTVYSKQIRALN